MTPTMTLVMVTAKPGQLAKSLPSFVETATNGYHALIVYNGLLIDDCPDLLRGWYFERLVLPENRGPLGGLQAAYEYLSRQAEPPAILAHFHDDVTMHEAGWDERVLTEFTDPNVGVVGFGGALGLGTDDLYKRPYDYRQLARLGYRSNTDDAEQHGERFTGACDVATLDGFSLIVRRELLERRGGWGVDRWPPHHQYDNVLCLDARRMGYRVRLVGVKCYHSGGATATTPAYIEWATKTKWGSDEAIHQASHPMMYEEYRDILPLRVRP